MEKIREHEASDRFNDFLDELHNDGQGINIGGLTYDYSRVLKEVDETRYNEEFNNWLNSQGLELDN